jgi:AcrR family transcriptional regulator
MATLDKPKRRVDGEASRSRILDAATEIAAERGYERVDLIALFTLHGAALYDIAMRMVEQRER